MKKAITVCVLLMVWGFGYGCGADPYKYPNRDFGEHTYLAVRIASELACSATPETVQEHGEWEYGMDAFEVAELAYDYCVDSFDQNVPQL